MRKTILLIFCTMALTNAWSQFYNTGTDPFKTHWRSINTEQFRLIYPREAELAAQKFASTLDYLQNDIAYSLDHNPQKIDIILHNQSVKSNGYVVWAPKRMELIQTPPQDNYAQNWIDQLALHEYRHVVQIDKLNTGFTKGLSYIFGQMGTGAVMSLLPLWYLEGDAVSTETALSNTGRGRDPGFIKEVKAAEMQTEKRHSYDEFYLGSYKNYIPNHYYYGYQMVAWSRNKYGASMWQNVIDFTGRHPYLITPFYFKLKNETGESKVSLYENTMDYLHEKWEQENSLQSYITTNYKPLKTRYKSKFVSYRFPYSCKKGNTLALRTSIDDIARIVDIDSKGKEKTLCRVGYFQGSKVSYTDKYIAWDEYQNNRRWEQSSYSTIRIYNRETHQSKTLQQKAKHFAPDISSDNKRIVLVKNDQNYKSSLEIWDIEKSTLLKQIIPLENVNLFYPKWLNNNSLAVIYLSERGKSIQLYDLTNNRWTEIVPPGFDNISMLDGNKTDIYFTCSYGGTESIYHVNINDKKVTCLVKDNLGVNYPHYDRNAKKLLFSKYSESGYKINCTVDTSFNKIAKSNIRPYTFELAVGLAKQERINIQDSVIPVKTFESKKYAKALHLINIHSWIAPFYINYDELPDENIQFYPGFTLLSQNTLSSITSTVSYYYKDGYHHFCPGISLRMFYPVINFEWDYGGAPKKNTYYAASGSLYDNLKNYYEINTSISQPLSFSNSRYILNATPSIYFRYKNTYVADSINRANPDFYYDNNYYSKGYASLDYRFNFYMASPMSNKDLRYPWFFQYYFSHLDPILHEIYYAENTVQMVIAQAPGFYRHHSTRVLIGLENGYGRRMSLSRGYSNADLYTTYYNKANKITLDYALPLLYPNLSIGPIAYFKRVQALVFYDYFQYSFSYNNKRYNTQLNSVGVELGVETNLLRFFWTFVPTLQYSYRLEDGGSSVAFSVDTQYSFSLGKQL